MPEDKIEKLFVKMSDVHSDVKVLAKTVSGKVESTECSEKRHEIFEHCSQTKYVFKDIINDMRMEIKKIYVVFGTVITGLTLAMSIVGFVMKFWKLDA